MVLVKLLPGTLMVFEMVTGFLVIFEGWLDVVVVSFPMDDLRGIIEVDGGGLAVLEVSLMRPIFKTKRSTNSFDRQLVRRSCKSEKEWE